MMSLHQIRELNRQASMEAALENKAPYTVEAEDKEDWALKLELDIPPAFPFPYLGSHVADGWLRTDRTLVVQLNPEDPAGNGVLTFADFVKQLTAGQGYGVTEFGRRSVTLGEYSRIETDNASITQRECA